MTVLINTVEPYLLEQIDFDLSQHGQPTILNDHVDIDEEMEASIKEKQMIHEKIQAKFTHGARQHIID
jgi:hypothetical protein